MSDFLSSMSSIVIAVTNTVFVSQLRNYRMKQKKEKYSAKVRCSASKTTEKNVCGDNMITSISSARTESRPETETFQFSDEDMKAVKFVIFWSNGLLILLSVFFIAFFAVKVVNEKLEKDIDFWAYLDAYMEYIFGFQNLISFISRESTRASLLNRYSSFIRK